MLRNLQYCFKRESFTYGILHQDLPYGKNYSHNELQNFAKKISDSLSNSKSLTYFLNRKLTVLDTLNPSDRFRVGNNKILFEFRPKYSKDKIDFNKIAQIKTATRVDNELSLNINSKLTKHLGSYDLSEPIFIKKDEAVIRYQYYCGSKCGLGILIYVKKINKQWKIFKEKQIWIS